jgi:hypothetical protein
MVRSSREQCLKAHNSQSMLLKLVRMVNSFQKMFHRNSMILMGMEYILVDMIEMILHMNRVVLLVS